MDIETDIGTIEDTRHIESKTDIEENENNIIYIRISNKKSFFDIFCNFIDKHKFSIFIIYFLTVIILIAYLM